MSYEVSLVDEFTAYVNEHFKDDEAGRLNIAIANELVTLIDAIVEKSGRSRSFVVEQMLFFAVSKSSSSIANLG
jgi:hypothetical protein